jgi:hypothetical protein
VQHPSPRTAPGTLPDPHWTPRPTHRKAPAMVCTSYLIFLPLDDAIRQRGQAVGAAVLHHLPAALRIRPQHIVLAQQRDLVGCVGIQMLHGCNGVPSLGPAELRRLGWFRVRHCCWGGLRGGGVDIHYRRGYPTGCGGRAAALQGVLAAAGEAPGGVAGASSRGQPSCCSTE